MWICVRIFSFLSFSHSLRLIGTISKSTLNHFYIIHTIIFRVLDLFNCFFFLVILSVWLVRSYGSLFGILVVFDWLNSMCFFFAVFAYFWFACNFFATFHIRFRSSPIRFEDWRRKRTSNTHIHQFVIHCSEFPFRFFFFFWIKHDKKECSVNADKNF